METECQAVLPQHIYILILQYIFKVKLANEEDNSIEKEEIIKNTRKKGPICGNISVIIDKYLLAGVGRNDNGQHDGIE